MSYSDAFDVPVTERIAGQDVIFPILSLSQLREWVSALTSERRASARKLMPKNMEAVARWQLDQKIDAYSCSLNDLADHVVSFDGAEKVLRLSLSQSERKPEEIDAILSQIARSRLQMLAQDVSGLFDRRALPKQEGQSDPNAHSPAAQQNPAGVETSSQTTEGSSASMA